MKNIFSLLLLVFCIQNTSAQITRYPYIQSTSQNSVIIAWRTSSPVLGSVKFGSDSFNLNTTVYEVTAGFNHGVLLENLQENTKYYYGVFSGANLETIEYFYTAKDSTNNDFSFIQYGDCGYNNVIQHQVGALMESDPSEFAVVCGDIDQGGVPHISESDGGDDYDEIYFDVYNDGVNAKMLSRECHYTSIGNHDYYANNGAEYDSSFYLPHNNAENSERYYSFTWGDAKFIALDVITPFDNTTFPINFASIDDRWWTDFRAGSPQYQFLEDELKCNDKKWVFVYFHEGPWTNYWGADYNIPINLGGDYYQYEGNIMVRNHLVPLFEQYDVDFVLSGHSHLYERGEKNGVTYVTSGSAGDSNPGGNIQHANHPELLVDILDNVYARFSVNDDSVYLECVNKDSLILDTYTRTKIYQDYLVTDTVTNVSCFQGSDGTASINAQGPKGPYSIEWFDDGSTNFARTNLSANTYFAYIRNVYGCEKVVSVVIEEPSLLIPQIVSLTGLDEFCVGDIISLSTSNTYQSYTWSTEDISAQLDLYTEETVTVEVVSTAGCVGNSAPFSVNFIEEPTANFNFANSGFNYNFLAQNDPYTDIYTWSFDDGSVDTSLTTNLVNHVFLTDGNYSVTLYASNDCATDTFVIDVKVGTGDTIIDTIPDFIVNIENAQLLSFFPNPFEEFTTVKAKGFNGSIQVELYNLIGEKVLEFKTRKRVFEIKRGKLASGQYYLKIEDKNQKVGFAKMIIN